VCVSFLVHIFGFLWHITTQNCIKHNKNARIKMCELTDWLQCESACLASVRPWVQTLILTKKKVLNTVNASIQNKKLPCFLMEKERRINCLISGDEKISSNSQKLLWLVLRYLPLCSAFSFLTCVLGHLCFDPLWWLSCLNNHYSTLLSF
jgi:hypothetical protein